LRDKRRLSEHRTSRARIATPRPAFLQFVANLVRRDGHPDNMAQSIILLAAPRTIRQPALPYKENP